MTLFETYLVVAGILGTLALQLIIWPQRFLPKAKPILSEPSKTAISVEGKTYDFPLHFLNEMPGIERLIPLAKGEIWLHGVGFPSIHNVWPTLDELLRNNTKLKLRFMVLDPNDEALIDFYEKTGDQASTKSIVGTALDEVHNLKKRHDGQVEIKTAKFPILHSAIIIDPKSEEGIAQIGFYHYNSEPATRSLNLVKGKQKDLVVKSFEWAWEKADLYPK